MDDYFALSPDEQRGYCELAAAQIKLDAPSIEKDFWVCWVLRETFRLPKTGSHLTFKGGTSLSKGWKLIQRLSEDIDVVIAREFLGFGGDKEPEAAESRKQREVRLEELRDACRVYVQNVLNGELEAVMHFTATLSEVARCFSPRSAAPPRGLKHRATSEPGMKVHASL